MLKISGQDPRQKYICLGVHKYTPKHIFKNMRSKIYNLDGNIQVLK